MIIEYRFNNFLSQRSVTCANCPSSPHTHQPISRDDYDTWGYVSYLEHLINVTSLWSITCRFSSANRKAYLCSYGWWWLNPHPKRDDQMQEMNMRFYQHNVSEEVLLTFSNEPLTYTVDVNLQRIFVVHLKQHELNIPIIPQHNHRVDEIASNLCLNKKKWCVSSFT